MGKLRVVLSDGMLFFCRCYPDSSKPNKIRSKQIAGGTVNNMKKFFLQPFKRTRIFFLGVHGTLLMQYLSTNVSRS